MRPGHTASEAHPFLGGVVPPEAETVLVRNEPVANRKLEGTLMSTNHCDVDLTPQVDAPDSRQLLLGLCGIALCIYGMAHISGLVTRKERFLGDFVQEWTSARNWRIGRPVYQDLRESIPFYFPKARTADLRFNAHPPVAVVLALPFGYMSYLHALKAWNLLSLACVVIATYWLTGRRGFDLASGERLLVAGIVLSSSVLATQLLQGQLNGVLLLLIIIAWLCARHDRAVWSGVFVGLAAATKLFPGLLIVYFLARQQWKASVAVMATWMIANFAATGILGIDATRDYLLVVMPDVSRFCDTWPNASLLGFLSRLFDGSFGQVTPLMHWPALAKTLWVTLSLLLIGLTAFVTSRSRGKDSAFSAWVSLMLVVSPVAWDHYFLLSVLPLAALWHLRGPCPSQRSLFLFVAVALLVTLSPYQVWRFLVPGYAKHGMTAAVAQPGALLAGVSFQFYVSLAVFGSCLQSCVARTERGQSISPSSRETQEPELPTSPATNVGCVAG